MENFRQYIIKKLEENSKKYPKKIAIEEMDGSLTFQEIYRLVKNRSYLLRKELGDENVPVAIRLKDKKEILLTMLALIKIGKTILPLPYEVPEDKASIVIDDIRPQALISENDININIKNKYTFIDIEKCKQLKNIESIDDRDNDISYNDDNIFCILMTSGTTGVPKGCQLSDKSFLGRIYDLSEYFPMTEGDKFMFFGNYSFDVTFTQMFCWLFGEGNIVIPRDKDKFDKIPQYVEKFKISHIAVSPSILRHIYEELKEKCDSLKYVFVAGEKFPVEVAERYSKEKAGFELLNLYGPTEFSIYATKYDVACYGGEKSVSIGTPLKGVMINLIDEKGNIIKETNTEGEITLSGKGIFNGYINNLQENKKNLIKINGAPAYKTGDLGYYSDGKYFITGRKDHQFKINGVRVEAEEIENKILQYNPLIKEAVVSYESYNKKNILIAYISWKDKKNKISQDQVIKNLKRGLEKYFIPKFIVSVDKIPLNKNGKVDRVSLHEIFMERIENDSIGENLSTEKSIFKIIKNIWETTLGVPLKNENTDFFLSGGDSLDCVVMMVEIEKMFGISITEEEFIGHSTFDQLISLIAAKNGINDMKKTDKTENIDWNEIGAEIINEDGERILIGNLDSELYELINLGLPIKNQVDKICMIKDDIKSIPQVVREFPLFSRQEFYLRKGFDSILETSLIFDFPNYPKLIVALNKFMKNQQLARSLIRNHRFVEFSYVPIDRKNLDFIDLAFLKHKESDRVLSEKIQIVQSDLIKKSPDIQMIRFLLVRETFKRAKLYMFVSHHIADAASINVFKNQILSYYTKNEEYKNIPLYETFVNSVISTNDESKLYELSESNYYMDIKSANDSFKKFFKFDTSIKFDEYEFDLETNSKDDRANILFAELAKRISQRTGASSFAFQILKNLRYFAGVDYKDIFADIHCSIYTSYNVNNEKDQKLFSKSEEDLKNVYERKGIHIDYLTSSDKFFNNSMIASFEETFLNINYLGEIRHDEVHYLIKKLRTVSEQLAKLHSNKIRFTCFSSGNKGYLISLGGILLKD